MAVLVEMLKFIDIIANSWGCQRPGVRNSMSGGCQNSLGLDPSDPAWTRALPFPAANEQHWFVRASWKNPILVMCA